MCGCKSRLWCERGCYCGGVSRIDRFSPGGSECRRPGRGFGDSACGCLGGDRAGAGYVRAPKSQPRCQVGRIEISFVAIRSIPQGSDSTFSDNPFTSATTGDPHLLGTDSDIEGYSALDQEAAGGLV